MGNIIYAYIYLYTYEASSVNWPSLSANLAEKSIQLQLTAQVSNIFLPDNFTIFPSPTPIDKRTQSISTANRQREIYFPLFAVPSIDHYSNPNSIF